MPMPYDITVDEGYENGFRILNQNGEVIFHGYTYNGSSDIGTEASRFFSRKRTSDVASKELRIYSDHAYPAASTYKTGGVTRISGGVGVRRFTITDYSLINGAVFKFCVNGGLSQLVAGTDFSVGSSNADAAANLVQCIIDNQIISLGTQLDAWSSGGIVYIQPHQHQHWFEIYVNHAGVTYESFLNGEVSFLGSYLASYRDGLTTNDIYPAWNLQARKWASSIGDGFGVGFNMNISEVNSTLGSSTTIGRVAAFRSGANNTGTLMLTPFNGGSINRSYFLSTSAFYPYSHGGQDLGLANQEWDDVYANNGTIITSDENYKEQIRDITKAEIKALKRIKIVAYKLKESVKEKGNSARWHYGVTAQQLIEAYKSEGLDALEFGVVGFNAAQKIDCYEYVIKDQEDEEGNPTIVQRIIKTDIFDDSGNPLKKHFVRYSELNCALERMNSYRLSKIENYAKIGLIFIIPLFLWMLIK